MDVVMGECPGNDESADPNSKLGSLVQINSIAVDISNSIEEMKSPVHQHFSIRGYVAGMRKKDWKTCSPFESEGNDVDLVNHLPPLSVPEFRWWQCSSCILNVEMKKTTKEMIVATENDANTRSYENVGGKNSSLIHRKTNTDATDMVCHASHPSFVVEEPDNAFGRDDTFGVLPHRRKPKLRSLADILVEEGTQTSSSPRTRFSSSCGLQVASTEMEAVLVPQLQVDVSADVAKAARSPERKRKIDLGEDREPLMATFPRAVLRRTRGPVLESEKISRRVKFSDQVSKEDTQRSKPKKAKAIDASKKTRQIRRDDEIAQMGENLQPNNVSSTNLPEQVAPVETNLVKSGGAPLILVEMGAQFRNSLSGKQKQKVSDLSIDEMPENGASDKPLLPPKKSILGNCKNGGTVALDLSLNSFMDAGGNHNERVSFRERRCIPDLNEEFPEKAAIEEEQDSTTISEEWSLPLQKILDSSASCSYETVRDGKRISEPRNKDKAAELEPSDDIPIEIVELLAKNQHERALGNSKRHRLGINDTIRGYASPVILDGTANFPLPSRRNGYKVANGKYQMDMRKPEKSHFRFSSSSTPSQPRKPEYSTPASVMAGRNSITWEDMLYSRATENVPFRLSIPQNRPTQPRGVTPRSFLDECHKEWSVEGKGKKVVADVAEHKEERIIGSSDPYMNDAIPAMQLLSLMDHRVKSGSSYKVSSLGMPLSSCKNLPPLNGKKNHNLLHGSFFPQNSGSLLRYGAYSSGESSFRASSSLRVPQEVRNSKTTLLDGCNELERREGRSNAALGECTLNRNPADFSIPEVGNEFTISANDLRPRKNTKKTNDLEEKSRLGRVDGRKRRRTRKY